jgi:hypothetical protein
VAFEGRGGWVAAVGLGDGAAVVAAAGLGTVGADLAAGFRGFAVAAGAVGAGPTAGFTRLGVRGSAVVAVGMVDAGLAAGFTRRLGVRGCAVAAGSAGAGAVRASDLIGRAWFRAVAALAAAGLRDEATGDAGCGFGGGAVFVRLGTMRPEPGPWPVVAAWAATGWLSGASLAGCRPTRVRRLASPATAFSSGSVRRAVDLADSRAPAIRFEAPSARRTMDLPADLTRVNGDVDPSRSETDDAALAAAATVILVGRIGMGTAVRPVESAGLGAAFTGT